MDIVEASSLRTSDKALEALLVQYKSIRAEINLETTAQKTIINYSIALIAGSFLVASIKVENALLLEKYPFIFLLIALFQLLITWTAEEAEYTIHELRAFIDGTISKQIRELIDPELSDNYLRMELAFMSKRNKPRKIIRGLLGSAKLMIPYFHGLVMFIVFCFFLRPINEQHYMVIILFILTALLLVSVPYAIFKNIKFISKYYKSDEKA